MTRELRFKFTGTLFYIILAVNLVLTQAGGDLLRDLPVQVDLYESVAAMLGLGALLLTSEAVGFLFSTITIFWWNYVRGRFRIGFGGYSAEWRKLNFDLKQIILERYEKACSTGGKEIQHPNFKEKWKDYSPDAFLSYFWQQAPQPIVKWAMRRHTGFFTSMSAVVGIAVGWLLSAIIIFGLELGWTGGHTIAAIFSIVVAALFLLNAQYSRTEAWQIIDLWFSGALDRQLHEVQHEIAALLGLADQDESANGSAE